MLKLQCANNALQTCYKHAIAVALIVNGTPSVVRSVVKIHVEKNAMLHAQNGFFCAFIAHSERVDIYAIRLSARKICKKNKQENGLGHGDCIRCHISVSCLC